MTQEQQRNTIAQALGVKLIRHEWLGWQTTNAKPADYPADLNAMHEAEKVKIIRTEYESDYCMYLYENAHQSFATAAQRAEAFLRTLNLWL